jgi:hypothetical protein
MKYFEKNALLPQMIASILNKKEGEPVLVPEQLRKMQRKVKFNASGK